jgi:glycosyltransferase involved in cell wall biosynthesis
MTILHITDWANGGLATYLEVICTDQSKNHEVYLLASKKTSEARITQQDWFISLDPYERTIRGIWHALKISRKHIQTIQPDILYIHSSFAGVFARLATIGLAAKPKIIYCAHGWSFLMQGDSLKKWLYAWIEKTLSYFTDAIITISENEHRGALKAGIDKNKLHKISHGISPICDQLDPNFSKANTFSNQKLNILFLGRYDYSKGFDWLMKFIIKNPTDSISWHIAGKAIVDQKIPIPKEVTNHGWIPYEQIPQLLLRCDVVIIPSRWEGFGLTAIEAMKYMKPIIASKNGALPELVYEGKNGWLFDLNNDDALINILQTLQIKDLDAIGKNGYTLFIEKYTEREMIKALNDLISTLLSTKSN